MQFKFTNKTSEIIANYNYGVHYHYTPFSVVINKNKSIDITDNSGIQSRKRFTSQRKLWEYLYNSVPMLEDSKGNCVFSVTPLQNTLPANSPYRSYTKKRYNKPSGEAYTFTVGNEVWQYTGVDGETYQCDNISISINGLMLITIRDGKIITETFDNTQSLIKTVHHHYPSLRNDNNETVFSIVSQVAKPQFDGNAYINHGPTNQSLKAIADDSSNINDFLIGIWHRYQQTAIKCPFSMLIEAVSIRFKMKADKAKESIIDIINERKAGGFGRVSLHKMITDELVLGLNGNVIVEPKVKIPTEMFM